MSDAEESKRMRRLRSVVKRVDTHRWAGEILREAMVLKETSHPYLAEGVVTRNHSQSEPRPRSRSARCLDVAQSGRQGRRLVGSTS